LITRAPSSASWRVANGAATACSHATTTIPSRGSTSLSSRPRCPPGSRIVAWSSLLLTVALSSVVVVTRNRRLADLDARATAEPAVCADGTARRAAVTAIDTARW
jgi:hypothetical protein